MGIAFLRVDAPRRHVGRLRVTDGSRTYNDPLAVRPRLYINTATTNRGDDQCQRSTHRQSGRSHFSLSAAELSTSSAIAAIGLSLHICKTLHGTLAGAPTSKKRASGCAARSATMSERRSQSSARRSAAVSVPDVCVLTINVDGCCVRVLTELRTAVGEPAAMKAAVLILLSWLAISCAIAWANWRWWAWRDSRTRSGRHVLEPEPMPAGCEHCMGCKGS